MHLPLLVVRVLVNGVLILLLGRMCRMVVHLVMGKVKVAGTDDDWSTAGVPLCVLYLVIVLFMILVLLLVLRIRLLMSGEGG